MTAAVELLWKLLVEKLRRLPTSDAVKLGSRMRRDLRELFGPEVST